VIEVPGKRVGKTSVPMLGLALADMRERFWLLLLIVSSM
jgi:hypothetical protein